MENQKNWKNAVSEYKGILEFLNETSKDNFFFYDFKTKKIYFTDSIWPVGKKAKIRRSCKQPRTKGRHAALSAMERRYRRSLIFSVLSTTLLPVLSYRALYYTVQR